MFIFAYLTCGCWRCHSKSDRNTTTIEVTDPWEQTFYSFALNCLGTAGIVCIRKQLKLLLDKLYRFKYYLVSYLIEYSGTDMKNIKNYPNKGY